MKEVVLRILKSFWLNKFIIMAFIVPLYLFGYLCRYQYGDIFVHTKILHTYISFHSLPANFLYYLTIWAVGLFQNQYTVYASMVVLSGSVLLKYFYSIQYAKKQLGFNFNNQSAKIEGIKFILFLLLFIHPLLNYFRTTDIYYYLGKFPINIWHNSTIIFLMPFVILLFYKSLEYLDKPDNKKLLILLGLCLLNIFIKPSFFFSFAIGFPIIFFLRYKFNKNLFLLLTMILLSGLFLLLQYYMLYKDDLLTKYFYNGQVSHIVIKPFAVWHLFSNNLLKDFLVSFSIPIIYMIFYFKSSIKNTIIQYAWILVFCSFLIFIFIAEDGPRMGNGNFIWQVYASNYILYLVIIVDFIKLIFNENHKFNYKDQIILLLFFYSVFCGIVYIMKNVWFLSFG